MTDYISQKAIITWIEKSLAMYHDKYSTDMLHMFGLFRSVIEDKSLFPAADVRPVVHGENIGIEYAACDQFVCSKCGIELQDWRRVERDEDDGDVTYHEYVFCYCPNCGARNSIHFL